MSEASWSRTTIPPGAPARDRPGGRHRERTLIAVANHEAIVGEAFGALQVELARVTSDPVLAEAFKAKVVSALFRAADGLHQAAARLGAPGDPAAGLDGGYGRAD
jgi:hypothetical protein